MTGPPFPDFVVAGAARAGSTAVVESLRTRPEVFVTRPKEPHFLALAGRPASFTGPGDDTTVNRVAVTDHDAYGRLFADATPGQLRGEGSVSTLYHHAEAAPRLRRLNPEAKVLVVLRDPVSRAYSSHQYLLNRGLETEPDLLQAVAREQERRQAGWHHLWHYTAMSRYADAVADLLETFPGSVGVWWHDDLVEDEESTLAEMHAFLGLPPLETPLSVGRVNVSGTPRRRVVQSAMHAASRSGALRTVVKACVPFDVRERIRAANLAGYDVPADVRRQLAPLFDDDLDRLERVLDRPVPQGWRRR